MASASSAEEQPEQFHLWYTEGLRAQERGELQLTYCQPQVLLANAGFFFFFLQPCTDDNDNNQQRQH